MDRKATVEGARDVDPRRRGLNHAESVGPRRQSVRTRMGTEGRDGL